MGDWVGLTEFALMSSAVQLRQPLVLSELCRGPQKTLSIDLWEFYILNSTSLCVGVKSYGGS